MSDAVLITLIVVVGVIVLFFGIVAVGLYIDRRDRPEPRRLSHDPMAPSWSKDQSQ